MTGTAGMAMWWRTARRTGLTLLELIVVLTILLAITGLVVPMLPNFVHRANIASCTTNISELDKLVQTYQNLYSTFPDRLDTLASSDSALVGYVLPGSQPSASIVAGTLTTDDAHALTEKGINNVQTLIAQPTGSVGDWSPTMWPYSATKTATMPAATPVAAGTPVGVLTAIGARYVGLPEGDNYRYLIFGLGPACTLYRNLATEPAYHFADTPTEDPSRWYMCFAVIFMTQRDRDGAAEPLGEAKFMGTVAFHDFGLATAGAHTKEWWERLRDERPLTQQPTSGGTTP